jgi:hypothetical protein
MCALTELKKLRPYSYIKRPSSYVTKQYCSAASYSPSLNLLLSLISTALRARRLSKKNTFSFLSFSHHTSFLPNTGYLQLFKHCCASVSPFRAFLMRGSICDHLCGLVVRVPDYRFRGPGSIPGATRFLSSGSETGSTQLHEYN